MLGNWCHRFAGVYCLKETLPNTAATAMSGEMGDELQRESDKSSLHFFSNFFKITAGPWAPCVVPPNAEDMLLLLDGVAIRSPAIVLEHLATATPTVTVPLLPWNCLA